MKKQPFFRKCICTKVLGGKRSLWHAKLKPATVCFDQEDTGLSIVLSGLTGAGSTGELAILDLQRQFRRATKRIIGA